MTLDQLEMALGRLDSAIAYLRTFEPDSAAAFFFTEHLANDLDAILDPVQRLIGRARQQEKRLRRAERVRN